ncbi:LexA family protein [Spartinivicinus ruber]|uniref:LexA family protein n=1 Tax=Spartinivicinus ruber TaxID=2683272 RepID=UPI0013D19F20|nr:S24 family peptidase [Spartinivicinus ruber]
MHVTQLFTAKQIQPTEKVPLLSNHSAFGDPFPINNHAEAKINLHEFIVKDPLATFFVQVEGEPMLEVRIRSGDLLMVDRSLTPQNGSTVIAELEKKELTVKEIQLTKNKAWLITRNPQTKPINITGYVDNVVWGVVVHRIHSCQ